MRIFCFVAAVLFATPVGAQQFTIVYRNPQAKEASWFEVVELPSYIFAPRAPIIWASRPPRISVGLAQTTAGDLDCADIGGTVWVGNNDPHRLDGDGDGWGCE